MFLAFYFITAITTIPMNIYYFNKKEEISKSVQQLNNFKGDLLQTLLIQSDFLNYETRNTRFFKTNRSLYLDSLNEKQNSLNEKITELIRTCEQNKFKVSGKLEHIKTELNENNYIFNQMVSSIYRRGFKDWGVEGQMRDQVHLLENFADLDQRAVLSLRRHEKDYMLRNDSSYVHQLNSLVEKLLLTVKNDAKIEPSTRVAIRNMLVNYQRLFNKLVRLDQEIGIRSKTGYSRQLLATSSSIEQMLNQVQADIEIEKNQLIGEIELAYVLSSILLIIISIFISYVISKKITQPIQELSQSLKTLVKRHFKQQSPIVLNTRQKEITSLASEFNRMIEQLRIHEEQSETARHDLLVSEKKFRELTEWLPQGVFEVNSTGYLSYINQAMKQQFGLTDDDIQTGYKMEWLYQELNESETGKQNEVLALTKEATTFHALLYVSNPQNSLGQRGLFIDISERRAYLEELKKEKLKAENSDKLKSAFLANMSHEIRTPMNAIIGFSEILKDPGLTADERAEFIGHINTNGETLLNLIEDIIDIAKIESGHIRIEPATTNLNEMFHELELSMNEVRKIHANDQVQLINDQANANQQDFIWTDPLRLRQVLINLLTNALKFTETGTVRFGYQIKHDRQRLLFYVRDTGIGIPEDKLQVIFERFRKVYSFETKHYRGTGLGLYISKTIINHMEGEIWVNSSVGEGSTFYFEIPYLPQENKLSTTESHIKPYNYSIENARILIAEDQEFNFLLLKTILEKAKAKVFQVKNGYEALDFFFDKKMVDLILMDLHMPEMDGYEAIKQLKKLHPEIPIIVQTANAMTGDKEKCLQLGADDYIAKPVNQQELILKIARLVNVNAQLIPSA